ncbi:hypothetical protein ACLOJK_017354 [Asimina triloba]
MSDALINGLAGAGGGIIAQLITYPLQTVNTRQQTQRDPKDSKKKRHGTIEQMCKVVKQEGWGRLYGGLSPSLVGTAASQLVFINEESEILNRAEAAALVHWKNGSGDGSVGMLASLVVAAMAGFFLTIAWQPSTMLDEFWWLQAEDTHTKSFKKSQAHQTLSLTADDAVQIAALEPLPYGTNNAVNLFTVDLVDLQVMGVAPAKSEVQEVYDEAGFWGFWKGVLPTLIMVSNPSIQFMLYETLLKQLKKRQFLSKKRTNEVSALEAFLLGAVAKLGATVVTYPLLVVKSRLQAKQVKGGDKTHHYKGSLESGCGANLSSHGEDSGLWEILEAAIFEFSGGLHACMPVAIDVDIQHSILHFISTVDAITKMIHYEGFKGFYKGMSTKIVQSVLAAAILFMVKEELVKVARLLLVKDASLR